MRRRLQRERESGCGCDWREDERVSFRSWRSRGEGGMRSVRELIKGAVYSLILSDGGWRHCVIICITDDGAHE